MTSVINNKICPKSKRSQIAMSFGMIFSIILIVFFIVFAFYGINKFLKLQKEVQIKRVGYDSVAAGKKIMDAGLPKFLGERLMIGR